MKKSNKSSFIWWLCPQCNSQQRINAIELPDGSIVDVKDAHETSYGPCMKCGWEGSYNQLAKGNHQDFSKLRSFIQHMQEHPHA